MLPWYCTYTNWQPVQKKGLKQEDYLLVMVIDYILLFQVICACQKCVQYSNRHRLDYWALTFRFAANGYSYPSARFYASCIVRYLIVYHYLFCIHSSSNNQSRIESNRRNRIESHIHRAVLCNSWRTEAITNPALPSMENFP